MLVPEVVAMGREKERGVERGVQGGAEAASSRAWVMVRRGSRKE
jgi:hypothetical protein